MSVALLIGLVAAALLGAITHEIAHWIVWRVAGRRPRLDLWRLEVRPRAGPQATTWPDRVAAAAPYLLGATAVVSGVLMARVLLMVFGGAMIQIPSRVDVATILGRTEWALE